MPTLISYRFIWREHILEYVYFVKYESCFRTPQKDFVRKYVELFCLYDLYIYRKISLKFDNLPKTYRKVQQLITQFYLKQRRVLVKNSRFFPVTVLTTIQFTRVMWIAFQDSKINEWNSYWYFSKHFPSLFPRSSKWPNKIHHSNTTHF